MMGPAELSSGEFWVAKDSKDSGFQVIATINCAAMFLGVFINRAQEAVDRHNGTERACDTHVPNPGSGAWVGS